MTKHELAAGLRERQIACRGWEDVSMPRGQYLKILRSLTDDDMIKAHIIYLDGSPRLPLDVAVAAVNVTNSTDEWLEVTRQIGDDGASLRERPEPQQFQNSRTTAMLLMALTGSLQQGCKHEVIRDGKCMTCGKQVEPEPQFEREA
jgi:hypothetical protein